MGAESEDDYDHLSQDACSDSDSHALVEAIDGDGVAAHEADTPDTPRSSPPESGVDKTRLIPSRTKRLHCTWEGCDKAFVRQSRLDEHLRTHTNTRLFACPEEGCAKAYFRDSHLKVHIKSAHSAEKDYKCTWEGCTKSFATGQRLRNHIKTHECGEKYKCTGYEGCSEAFRKKEMLRRHVVSVHEQRKPFPCPDMDQITGDKCTKAFDTAQKLRSHQKSSHNETRYSCAECVAFNAAETAIVANSPLLRKAYFATLLQLEAHNAEFHPPTCPHCRHVCSTERQLKSHLELVHDIIPEPAKTDDAAAATSKPRVVCPHPGCGKTYSKTGNLNMHIRTFHERGGKFICGQSEVPPDVVEPDAGVTIPGCGKVYTGKQAFTDHLRRHLGLESLQVSRKRKAAGKERRAIKKLKNSTFSRDSDEASDGVPAFVWPAIDYDESGESEDGAVNGLSESMSMLGSHIFHRGESFHYPSGEYPSSSFNSAAAAAAAAELNPNHSNPYQPVFDEDEDDDPFFGHMDGLSDHDDDDDDDDDDDKVIIDPRLLVEHV